MTPLIKTPQHVHRQRTPSDLERKRINAIGPVVFDTPARVNRDPYIPAVWHVRPGADANLDCKSLG